MQRKIAITLFIFLAAVFSLHCSENAEPGTADRQAQPVAVLTPKRPALENGDTLTLGSISNTVKEEIATFQPVADYLAARLGAHGIAHGEVKIASDVDEMISLMAQSRVDLYIDSVFPITAAMVYGGAVPFLRRWKRGHGEYHSVIFTHKDRNLHTLADLTGQTLAFDDTLSTSGHLLPLALLQQAGYHLVNRTEATLHQRPAPDQVGYIFSGDDENTLFWVVKGKVAAGVADNISFEAFAASMPDQLVVLARSASAPRQAVMHRADLDAGLVTTIEELLLTMDQNEDGRRILADFQNTSKFDRFPDGLETTFGPFKDLLPLAGLSVMPQKTPASP